MIVTEESSLWIRTLYLFLACLQSLLLSGVLFGWTSISSSLLVYPPSRGGAGLSEDYVHAMFVAATFFSFLGPLGTGVILDSYGPRACSLVSVGCVAAGSLLFSYSNVDSCPLFIPAMCLIAFGGPGILNSVFHLSNLFPQWKWTATAVISGTLQLSFIVFFGFDQIWFYLHWDYQTIFRYYSLLGMIFFLISVIFWPDDTLQTEEDQLQAQSDCESEQRDHPARHAGPRNIHTSYKIHHSKVVSPYTGGGKLRLYKTFSIPKDKRQRSIKNATLKEQLMSGPFLLLTGYFVVASFWANFYIGTVTVQLGDAFQTSVYELRLYGRLFAVILTACGVIIPGAGFCMDVFGFPVTSALATTFAILWTCLLLTQNQNVVVISFFCYAIFRTFLFTFIFAYLADALGFRYFGALTGVLFAIGGLVGLLQYPIGRFAVGTCHLENPIGVTVHCEHGSWEQVNFVMLLCFLGCYLFSYSDYAQRSHVLAVPSPAPTPSRIPASPATAGEAGAPMGERQRARRDTELTQLLSSEIAV